MRECQGWNFVPELMPPASDVDKVRASAQLAADLDGARPGEWESNLAEFNRLAGTTISIEEFQGIYEAEDHEDWVRRLSTNGPLYLLTYPATR